jgi:hypothetical protein
MGSSSSCASSAFSAHRPVHVVLVVFAELTLSSSAEPAATGGHPARRPRARRAAVAVEARRPVILELSARIHANPEPAFEEFQAAAWCAEAIAAAGYAVEHPAGRLATAVRGRLTGGLGAAGPRIGVLAGRRAPGHTAVHNIIGVRRLASPPGAFAGDRFLARRPGAGARQAVHARRRASGLTRRSSSTPAIATGRHAPASEDAT